MKIRFFSDEDFKKTLQDKSIKEIRKEILQKHIKVEKQETALPLVKTSLILTATDGVDLFKCVHDIDFTPYFFLQNPSRPGEETKEMQKLKEKIEQVEKWLKKEFKGFSFLPGVIEAV